MAEKSNKNQRSHYYTISVPTSSSSSYVMPEDQMGGTELSALRWFPTAVKKSKVLFSKSPKSRLFRVFCRQARRKIGEIYAQLLLCRPRHSYSCSLRDENCTGHIPDGVPCKGVFREEEKEEETRV